MKNKNKWVSVNEDLPETYEPGISIVVNVTDGKGVTSGYYDFNEKQWYGYGFSTSEGGKHVTHWMHHPKPPIKNKIGFK